jgi:hypothetical protein
MNPKIRCFIVRAQAFKTIMDDWGSMLRMLQSSAALHDDVIVSRSDWVLGISLSILASVIGGASKIAIRKGWLLQMEREHNDHHEQSSVVRSNAIPMYASSLSRSSVSFDDFDDNDSYFSFEGDEIQSLDSISRSTEPITTNKRMVSACPFESLFGHRARTLCARDVSFHSSNRSKRHCHTKSTDRRHCCYKSKSICNVPLCLRIAGMIGMTTLNPLCCVLAMNYASPSILAPFSGLTLVWIVLWAGPMLGEQPTFMQLIAVALIIGGETIVALFGDHTNYDSVTAGQVVRSASPLCRSYKATALVF